MLLPTLPLANIIDNLQDVGHQTGFDVQQFIAQCFCFIVLCAALQKFAWAPVRGLLEQRRQTIADAMANADKVKKELADAEAARLSIIQKANEKANAIIAEAQITANARAEQRAREAAAQAEDIIRKAHDAAVREINAANN